MNEQALRHAVKAFIDTNATEFMSGIKMNNQQRAIAHVAISEAALPSGTGGTSYPFIIVICSEATIRRIPGNTVVVSKSVYDVEVLVSDISTIQLGDTTPNETMDSNFRLLCDRIVNKIVTTKAFTYDSVTFRLIEGGDVLVTKTNNDGWIENTIFLGCKITFSVMEC